MERIVIVGGGLAGHRAAQVLRKEGYTGELILVGDEEHAPYDRPPLSKDLLAGTIEHDAVFLGGPDHHADASLGSPATALDPTRNLLTVGEREIAYDGLVIATGRRARPWPDLPGLDGFHTLRNLDDSSRLAAAARATGRAVIVGAGFIGCEVAATFRGLGVASVTLVEMAAWPMAVLGEEVGRRTAELHRRHGVELRMGATVEGFDGADGRVAAVRLAGGERLSADLVLLALGSLPNSEWLAGSGLELLRGAVVCDSHCHALVAGRPLPNVVVAGDIAAYPHPLAGEPISIEHVSNAREMGALAAANLVRPPADRMALTSVPTFWSDQYDVKINSCGLPHLADATAVTDDDPETGAFVLEARRGGELIGGVAFNRPRDLFAISRHISDRLQPATAPPANARS